MTDTIPVPRQTYIKMLEMICDEYDYIDYNKVVIDQFRALLASPQPAVEPWLAKPVDARVVDALRRIERICLIDPPHAGKDMQIWAIIAPILSAATQPASDMENEKMQDIQQIARQGQTVNHRAFGNQVQGDEPADYSREISTP